MAGLFYGGGTQVLIAQLIGSAIVTVATFVFAYAVMASVNAVGLLCVDAEGELRGIDVDEHGISAYPEYVISSVGMPSAMVVVEAPAQVIAASRANVAKSAT